MAVDLNEQTRGRLHAAYRAADEGGRAVLLAQLEVIAWWNQAARDHLEHDQRYLSHLSAFPWVKRW